jgi:tetratricopeptide (TPR) repeat protein
MLFITMRYKMPLFTHKSRETSKSESFSHKLQDYDALRSLNLASFEELNRSLKDLEEGALGVESHLSVLKRRRELTAMDFENAPAAYLGAAERAAAAFPASELLQAVAAEAAVLSAQMAEASLYAANITGPDLLPLALAVAVLNGDLASAEKAAALPRGGELLLAVSGEGQGNGKAGSGYFIRRRKQYIINAAILRILGGDIRGAGSLIQPLLISREEASMPEDNPAGFTGEAQGKVPEPAAPRIFAAEYYYDFGDPRRSAEIFARFGEDRYMSREADALVLAGEWEHAKSLWNILAAPNEEGYIITPPEILARCLYNLASVAPIPREESLWIQRLLSVNPNHIYGLIRYTRILPTDQALSILEGSELYKTEALIALEVLRRRRENWPVDKVIPETWLLVNRFRNAPPLYQWGAYYFDLQKAYGETSRLIRMAEQQGIDGPWLDFHRALVLIRQGNYGEAEDLLHRLDQSADGAQEAGAQAASGGPPGASPFASPGIYPDTLAWRIPANIGRLEEARLANARALEYYQAAAALALKSASPGEQDANIAQLQYRMARSLRALGRDREARKILEYGQTLDENNLAIRLELSRLDDLGMF